MIRIEPHAEGLSVFLGEVEILRHTASHPLVEIARADFHFKTTGGGLHRLNCPLRDRVGLRGCEPCPSGLRLSEGELSLELTFVEEPGGMSFSLEAPPGWNHLRLNLQGDGREAIYGGGIQFSHLDLRGRRYPIWTSEMGLGRHPLRPYTWLANWIADAGGEYWNTYFPQPSFLSTRGYGCMVETGGYAVLDFTAPDRQGLELLGGGTVRFFTGQGLKALLSGLASHLGVMPAPPGWVFEGGILGIQGGLPYVRETVDRVIAAGARLTGIWTQDWAGVRIFWQGKRLYWNWVVNEELYPGLKEEIQRRRDQGIRWLTYLNPYFNADGEYFDFARKNGFLVQGASGDALVYDVAGFQIGCLDLTNPSAVSWFQEEIIRRNNLELGVRGWMADYAEDIPEQARFHDGRTGSELHNLYPRLWAELNRRAVEQAGLEDEVLIFHRSGHTHATASTNMYWGGDQVVYWNRHDGFPSGVYGGLSGCLSGVQYYHTDAGGYFSFRWIKRSRELLYRWLEANAFSPILRTHEGNRPWAGVQPWQDAETLAHFARMTRLHAALAPYLARVSAQAQESGIGMLRPLCLEDPGEDFRDLREAYALGDDLLVYPVLRPGLRRMRIRVPEGEWVELGSGQARGPGVHRVNCPLGRTPVLYRRGSAFQSLFEEIGRLA